MAGLIVTRGMGHVGPPRTQQEIINGEQPGPGVGLAGFGLTRGQTSEGVCPGIHGESAAEFQQRLIEEGIHARPISEVAVDIRGRKARRRRKSSPSSRRV